MADFFKVENGSALLVSKQYGRGATGKGWRGQPHATAARPHPPARGHAGGGGVAGRDGRRPPPPGVRHGGQEAALTGGVRFLTAPSFFLPTPPCQGFC